MLRHGLDIDRNLSGDEEDSLTQWDLRLGLWSNSVEGDEIGEVFQEEGPARGICR